MTDWDDPGSTISRIGALLAQANEAASNNRQLRAVAGPIAQAIESIPHAGRIAIFQSDHPFGAFRLLAAPSFSQAEISTLWASLQAAGLDPAQNGPVCFSETSEDTGSNAALWRIFPLRTSWRPPGLVIIAAHEGQGAPQATAFETVIDELVRLANLVLEDQVLREMVKEERALFDGLVRTAPDAIIRIDAQGTILDFIGASERIFGYRADEICGHNISRLMPEPHAARHGEYLRAYLETGERKLPDFGRRLPARRRDGTLITVEIALSELHRADRTEFIGTVRDISQRVSRELESEQLVRALEEAGRQNALGELAASVAHEINQPLTSIGNYLDALDMRLAAGETDTDLLRDLAARAAREARFGGDIVRRLRSMVTVGEVDLAFSDFHDAVGEAVDIIRRASSSDGVNVQLIRNGEDAWGLFDRVQIQQVVLNLASNALTALRGRHDKSLRITSSARDDRFELEVADTGPGIPDSEKADVFTRFFKRSDGGMGLGLAIVRRIADMHDAKASVHDNPGGGALFRLVLPRRMIPEESAHHEH